MKFKPYTPDELLAIRRSGSILADALSLVASAVKPGITATDLDTIAERRIRELGGQPAFKGYHGYPASLCVSRNAVVVHGIPTADLVLASGDVVGLDLGVVYHGLYTDMARTVGVGSVKPKVQSLLEVTRNALQVGIRTVAAGRTTGDLGAAIQAVADEAGYGVIRDLVGHGVGRAIHEEPSISNYGQAGTGEVLRSGMTIAIEPMFTLGGYDVVTDADGWTVRTSDGSIAAHEEHTVLVTSGGCEILTVR